MPTVEKVAFKLAVKTSVAAAKVKLVSEIASAQAKTAKGQKDSDAANNLATAFTNYEEALLEAVADNIEAMIKIYMTRTHTPHMHPAIPFGPVLPPFIPAD